MLKHMTRLYAKTGWVGGGAKRHRRQEGAKAGASTEEDGRGEVTAQDHSYGI